MEVRLLKRFKDVKPISTAGTRKMNYKSKGGKLRQKITEIEEKGASALGDQPVSINVKENHQFLSKALKNCHDIVFRWIRLGVGGLECMVVFFNDMVDKDMVNKVIIKELMSGGAAAQNVITENESNTEYTLSIDTIKESILNMSEVYEVALLKDTVGLLMESACVVFIDTMDKALAIKASGLKGRSIGDPLIEQTIRGAQEAFVEDVDANVSLIRRRLKTPELKTESHILGTQGKTKLIIAYVKGIADEDIIKEAKKRISEINIDVLIGSGQLREYIEDDPLSPFPQIDMTERPDVAVAALAEGRIAFIMEGTPFVLIAPTTIAYLFNIPEDYYERPYYASFARMLRYIAFLIALLGPSMYIAITTFQPEMIPQSLLISILTSRSDVPFPALIEAALMELIFEIIREVSLRMPKNMGQSLSIVGGLVVGQLSVQAGLVAPIMIIVVAVTGLASFLIPKLNSSRQISVLRFPMMLLAGFFGVYGVIMGGLTILIHLVSLRSLGVPYLSPVTPLNLEGMKDTSIKLPIWMLNKRPSYIQRNNTNSAVPPERFKPKKGRQDAEKE